LSSNKRANRSAASPVEPETTEWIENRIMLIRQEADKKTRQNAAGKTSRVQ